MKRIEMAKAIQLLLLSFFLFTSSIVHATQREQKPLVMGFFPIISTVALFKRFVPLKNYLSDQLGREIVMETAKDFPTFVKRTAERRYDFVFTAPHFAVRAEDSGLYHIRVTPPNVLRVLIAVRKESAITDVNGLEGKRISSPPKGALVSMIGKDRLDSIGLTGARLPQYQYYSTHNAAYQAVVGGRADAVISANNVVLKKINEGVPLKVIDQGEAFPSMAILVASDLPETFSSKLTHAMVEMKNTVIGQRVLKVVGFSGYQAASIADYEVVRSYAYRKKNAD